VRDALKEGALALKVLGGISNHAFCKEALAILDGAQRVDVVGEVNDMGADGFHVVFNEKLVPATKLYAVKETK
jgi:hypothetical protein